MECIMLFGLFGICTVQDIRKKRITMWVLWVFAVAGIVLHMVRHRVSLSEMLGGMLLGGIILLIAYLSKEKIGIGDACLLVVSGIYLGFWANAELFIIGEILAALYGLFLVIFKKMPKNTEIPFVPFLLCSYVILVLGKLVTAA